VSVTVALLVHATLWSAVGSSCPAAAEAQTTPRRSLSATLAGAGVGVAAGFGLAGATDYELQEGGLFVVVLLGGGLGAATGHKLSLSAGGPWRTLRPVQVAFPWAHGWSESSGDVRSAFSASGYRAEDSHHALVPAVTLTVDAGRWIRIGAEISGIRGVLLRGDDEVARVSESVDGHSVSLFAVVSTTPSRGRRLTYFGGGGLGRDAVTALSYFDQKTSTGIPPDVVQRNRSSRASAARWSPQIRGGLEVYLTDEVSLKMEAVRRWADTISVPSIELTDLNGVVVSHHGAHSVSLTSFHLSLGLGMRY
jgi:hypothetical protein